MNDSRLGNQIEMGEQIQRSKGMESDMLSEGAKMTVNDSFQSEEYNPTSNQKQADKSPRKLRQNETNFITLGNISEEEKVEIIKTGFRLNQEGKISLKKYYEGTDQDSLFQLKGYSFFTDFFGQEFL